jgi:hypothetical protein
MPEQNHNNGAHSGSRSHQHIMLHHSAPYQVAFVSRFNNGMQAKHEMALVTTLPACRTLPLPAGRSHC